MATSESLNMVQTEVKINGTPCDFKTLQLFQSVSTHHTFSIVVNYKPDTSTLWEISPDEIFKQLGQEVYIRMFHIETEEVTEFFGVITDIEIEGNDGDEGVAIIKGGSPTLVLDRDPSMGAYTDYTLQDIVSEILEESGAKIEVDNNPAFSGVIPYAARYKETSYGFLSRLLRSFGEWFYYDGNKLIVGNPGNETTAMAAYDMELQKININCSVTALNREVYDYNPLVNENFNDAPPASIDGENSYMRTGKGVSDTLYPTAGILPASRAIVDENDLVGYMAAVHSRNYSATSTVTAVSNTCAIRLGELVVTSIPEKYEEVNIKDLGRFRVTEILHIIDSRGDYRNEFKGVAGATECMPDDPCLQQPVALPEVATVMDNEDPEQQGRVKVQFIWQALTNPEATTNWIRVQSPDAGSSDAIPRNRGFFFIPEPGDQVMVGFQQGDPSRPYVMGSLYHRDNTQGIEAGNTIKSIRTRSGHILEFNDDTEGDWGITIRDNNGNMIQLNSKENNMRIQTLETLDIIANNINISVGENLTIGTKKDLTVNTDGKSIITTGGNLEVAAEGNMMVSSKEYTNQAKNITEAADSELYLQGSSNVKLKGGDTSVQGSKVEIQGRSNKLELP